MTRKIANGLYPYRHCLPTHTVVCTSVISLELLFQRPVRTSWVECTLQFLVLLKTLCCTCAALLLIPSVPQFDALPDSSPAFMTKHLFYSWLFFFFLGLVFGPLLFNIPFLKELTGMGRELTFFVNNSQPQISSPDISHKFTFHTFRLHFRWSSIGCPISIYIPFV